MLERIGHVRENILSSSEAKKLGFSIKNKHYHGLGINNYIKIIKAMAKPISIYQYTEKGKYSSKNYILVTSVKINGNATIIPIEIKQKGQFNQVEIEYNRIKSVYYIDKKEYLQKMLDEGKIKEIFTQSCAEQISLDDNNI